MFLSKGSIARVSELGGLGFGVSTGLDRASTV